jgi:histidinol dehydrogenase
MQLLRQADPDFEARFLQITGGSSLFDPVIEQRSRDVLEAVVARGDQALVELTERFDGVRLEAEHLAVSTAALLGSLLQVGQEVREAVKAVDHNVASFAKRSLRRPWSMKNAHGATVGEKFDPLRRVGIYVPGGTAPLLSTALMTVTLARVAGCPEIVVCTPPARDGSIPPALLYAITAAGATEVYKVGGAQAIAAMALGTGMIPRVDKVFGPGNAYVVAAKRQLFGSVAIDLLPGPSEVLVLADDSANPAWIAADLLAQAEHGSGHERVWLVTTSARLIKAVKREIARQLPGLERRDLIRTALETGGVLIQAASMDAAVDLTNRLAPEHCELHVRRPSKLAERIVTAGALFLGPWSPTVLGDYVAGPSHTLPTGGAGRSFAGLTVDQFQRRTSVVSYDKASLKRALETVRAFAGFEGLGAHGRSAEIRMERA